MPIVDSTHPALIQTARSFRPTALTSEVAVVGEGQLTVALRVDGLILRFPRSEFALGELRRELGVLEVLRAHVSVALPAIEADELDHDIGRAFVAHRLLPGATLKPAVVGSLGAEAKAHLVERITTFLRELHAIPLSALPMVPKRSLADFAAVLDSEVHELLWSRLSASARRRAEDELAELRALPTELIVPCASDIGGNIVYDAVSQAVSFIDFGDTIGCDPVLDVASLSALHDGLAADCGRVYPVLGDRLERAWVVRGTFALQDVLYGARQEDWSYVDAILDEYERGARDATA
jgi:aminoglycoside phosphotransferase (APT) family kinase protein